MIFIFQTECLLNKGGLSKITKTLDTPVMALVKTADPKPEKVHKAPTIDETSGCTLPSYILIPNIMSIQQVDIHSFIGIRSLYTLIRLLLLLLF